MSRTLSSSLQERIAQQIESLQRAGLYRVRTDSLKGCDADLSFSSNDYLSLTDEPALKKAYQAGFERYPCGSGGSAVICGYHPLHQVLEQKFADVLGADAALLFPSGFAANLSLMGLFASIDATLLIDKQVHASVYDGLKLAQAPYRRYRHQDLAHLESELSHMSTNAIVLTEGLFSMSGQMADLPQMGEICARHQVLMVVDEAHSFGVFGPQGLGLVAQSGLTQEMLPLRLISFGKALAGQGAVVVGSHAWIDALLQQARAYIYSTAMSPALTYGMIAALDYVVLKGDSRRQGLFELLDYFQAKSRESTLPWRESQSAIQQLQLACPHRAQAVSAALLKTGIFCRAIRPPTVSLKDSGLRVVLNYRHTPKDIDRLFEVLPEVL